MRRVAIATVVALGLIFTGAGSAIADPTPAASATGPAIPVPAAQKPTTVCTVPSNTTNLTGIVATSSGYVVVDGADDANDLPNITYLNSNCSRNHTRPYVTRPLDPEDIVTDKSGTLWAADIGDGNLSRSRIALWKIPATGPTVLYHFTYPGGTPHPAKAMVLDGDGRPIFVTQPASGSGPSVLYEPAVGALNPNANVPLTAVGSFLPEDTGTDNKLEGPGRLLVTGGANSPDGTKVVLRTYSDAYEWTVTGGDVVNAIMKTTPLITAMPDEPQGEAISFTPDGKDFVTVSHVPSQTTTPILKYVPSTPAATKATVGSTGAKTPAKPSALRTWLTSLSLTDLKIMLASIGLIGLALVIIGILGIRRSRRRHREAVAAADRNPAANGRPGPARAPVGAAPGVYGPGGAPGGVYGAGGAPAAPGRGGGVYGAPGGAPGVYGAPRNGERRDYDPRDADPYAPPPPRPAGPSSGGPASGGAYSGGNYSGGQYSGGQYGAPVDPYHADPYQGDPYQGDAYQGGADYAPPPDGRRRSQGGYDEDYR